MTDQYQQYQDAADEAVYEGLFGATRAAVNHLFNLPANADEDQRRDQMGSLALRALRHAEQTCTQYIAFCNKMGVGLPPLPMFRDHIRHLAGVVATAFGVKGKALLTATYDKDVH